jgi:hypothetical protein
MKRPQTVNLELEDLPDTHTATELYITQLEKAILETIEDNLDLADGDVCTLIKLKRAINYA